MDFFNLLLQPFVIIIKQIFLYAYSITDNYGLAIVLLSFSISLLLLPIFIFIEKAKKKDDKIKGKMKPLVDEIKSCYKGQERYYYLKTLNRQYNYSPVRALIPVLSLLIQIPFFIAAYQFLESYSPLIGETTLLINDLSKADAIFGGINALPFVMTFVNLITVYFYTINGDKKERNQMIIVAIVFLVMLYSLPSALLIYWTLNNVFSFFRLFITNPEVFKRRKKESIALDKSNFSINSIKDRLRKSIKVYIVIITVLILIQLKWAYSHSFDDFGFRLLLSIIISTIIYIVYAILKPSISKLVALLKNINVEPQVYLSLLFLTGYFYISALVYYKHINESLLFISLLLLIPLELIGYIYYFRYRKLASNSTLFSSIIVISISLLQLLYLIAILSGGDLQISFINIERHAIIIFAGLGILITTIFLYFYSKIKRVVIPVFTNGGKIFTFSIIYILGQIFLWSPLMSFASFPEAFEFTAIDIIRNNILIVVISIASLLIVYKIIPKKLKAIITIGLLVIVAIAFINNTLFPFDLGTLQVNKFSEEKNLAAPLLNYFIESIIILSLLFVFIKLLKHKKNNYVAYALIVLNIITISQSAFELISIGSLQTDKLSVNKELEGERIINFSKTKQNIILLMPDMFQGLAMENIMAKNTEIVKEFSGFKWYRNTLSVSRVTNSTMPSLMGGFDYMPDILDKDTSHTVRQKMTRAIKSVVDRAHNDGYDVTMTKFPYTDMDEIDYDVLLPRWHEEWDSYNYKLGINSVKSDNSELLIESAVLYSVPLVFKALVYNKGAWIKSYFAKGIKNENSWIARSYNFLRLLPHISTTQNDKSNLILLYSFVTHFPWYYVDDNGILHSDVSPLTTNKWTLETFSMWIQWMKDNDVYDNTMIIIVSDHGVPWVRYEGEIEVDFPFTNLNEDKINKKYLLTLNPLLLVKDFNASGNLQIDNRFMSNADVNSIIFDENNPTTTDSLRSRTLPTFISWWAESIDKSNKFSYSYLYKVKNNIFDVNNWTRVEKE